MKRYKSPDEIFEGKLRVKTLLDVFVSIFDMSELISIHVISEIASITSDKWNSAVILEQRDNAFGNPEI